MLMKYELNGFVIQLLLELGIEQFTIAYFMLAKYYKVGYIQIEFLKSLVHYVNITLTHQRGYCKCGKPALSCLMGSFSSTITFFYSNQWTTVIHSIWYVVWLSLGANGTGNSNYKVVFSSRVLHMIHIGSNIWFIYAQIMFCKTFVKIQTKWKKIDLENSQCYFALLIR